MYKKRLTKCPITGSDSELVYNIRREFIINKLALYYKVVVPQEIVDVDYQIFKTKDTGFEFSYPMHPGSEKYYEWIIKQTGYYPKDRWEWGEIIKQIKRDSKSVSLLEVGCGSGSFLNRLKLIEHCKSVGVDTSEGAIKYCKEKGLDAFCSKIEDFEIEQMLDYVVSFHCLEHVEDPLGFVREMLNRVKSDGKVFISTPYSPMTFEYNWFDPLNHPPHHLTRWNVDSYKALAKKLDCCVEFLFPSPGSILRRAQTSLKIRWFGPGRSVSRKNFAKKILISPRESISEIFQQMKREKVNGKVAPNVILVKFWKK